MNKTFVVSTILLMALLSLSLFGGLARGTTYHIGTTWGSTYDQEAGEEAEHESVCHDINATYSSGSGWLANNFYGSYTTDSNVYGCSDAVHEESDYDYLSTFHVGHMWPDIVEYGHWEIVGENGWGMPVFDWFVDGTVRHYAYYGSYGSYNGIRDMTMYFHGGAKNYFTMIWTCTNADLFYNDWTDYGYYDSENGTGAVGMPYSWTQTLSLDTDGYNDPEDSDFCYIGFENVSKTLLEKFEGSATKDYGDFICAFYDHALNDQDCTINMALDRATYDMNVGMNSYDAVPSDQNNDLYLGWNEDVEGFEDPWFSRMRIFGDGDNVLGVVG